MSNTYNISATQGSTLLLTVTANDSSNAYINLSGYSARGYVKYSYGNTGILLNLNPAIHNSYVSGIVTISGSANDMANLPVGKFPYDLEIESSAGYVTKFLNGYLTVEPEVTN